MHVFKNIVARDYGDVIAAHDRSGHRFFLFEDSAADIARALGRGLTDHEIATYLNDNYDLSDANDVMADIHAVKMSLQPGNSESAESAEIALEDAPVADEDAFLDYCAENRIPYAVTWELTHACNLKCLHCYCPAPEPSFWNRSNIESTIDELYGLGVFEIAFTGGECTSHPEFDRTIGLAFERGFIFSILSNGLNITEERARLLSELPPRFVQLSVYSLRPSIHDHVTNVSGSFQSTMKAYQLLRNLGVRVNLACTVLRDNVDDVLDLANWAEKEGVEVTYGFKISPSENPLKRPMDMMPGRESIARLLSDPRINPFLKRCSDPSFLHLDPQRLDRPICHAGFRNFCLSAKGYVYPCNTLPLMLGDLRDQSISEIWNSSDHLTEWRKITRRKYSNCADCKAISVCEPCPVGWYREHHTLDSILDSDCQRGKTFYDLTIQAHSMGLS